MADYDITVDDAVAQTTLALYAREMGISVDEAVMRTARAVVVELAKVTAPFGTLSGRESWGAQRKVGLRAVARDMDRLLMPFEGLDVLRAAGNEQLRRRLDAVVRRKNKPAIRSILKNLGFEGISDAQLFPEDLAAWHDRQRNRRGSVRGRPRQAWVRQREASAYLRAKQKRVMRAKGGWTIPAMLLGAKLPAMVTKHAAPGSLLGLPLAEKNPHVTMTNNVSYIQGALDRVTVRFALRNQESRMTRQLNMAARINARRASARMGG